MGKIPEILNPNRHEFETNFYEYYLFGEELSLSKLLFKNLKIWGGMSKVLRKVMESGVRRKEWENPEEYSRRAKRYRDKFFRGMGYLGMIENDKRLAEEFREALFSDSPIRKRKNR